MDAEARSQGCRARVSRASGAKRNETRHTRAGAPQGRLPGKASFATVPAPQRGRQQARPAHGRRPMQITRVVLIGLALAALAAERAAAQERTQDYPSRQVNFIVPFAPGGGTDIIGRLVGQKLSDRFGKPFVIENRPGAGTVTAAVQVAKSTPDGYTIMMATSGTMAMNTTLYKTLPYHPGKDLILVAVVANVPFVLVVNPALPVNSVADLVKLAK